MDTSKKRDLAALKGRSALIPDIIFVKDPTKPPTQDNIERIVGTLDNETMKEWLFRFDGK